MRSAKLQAILFCFYLLGLMACTGTEVGNGLKPDDPEGKNGSEAPTSAGGATDGASEGAGGSTSSPDAGASIPVNATLPYLFADCASPLAEAGVSDFTAPESYKLGIKAEGQAWRAQIANPVLVASGLIKKGAATSDKPYGLEIVAAETLPRATSYQCSTVNSAVTNMDDGTLTQRSVFVTTESGVATVVWSVQITSNEAAKVTAITVHKNGGAVTFKRVP